MALHFARDDQDTVNLVGKQFLEFYYDNLNKKDYNQILTLIKPFSIASFQKNKYNGNNMTSLYQIYNDNCLSFHINDYDTLHSGARRINIMVTGLVSYFENGIQVKKNFSEYIHLATGKPGEFWIQMSIFKLI